MMPPKKKGNKRSSTESKEDPELNYESATDLLSPSEVVKMRKKTQPATSATAEQSPVKDIPKDKDKAIVKKSKTQQKSGKKDKDKSDLEKKKDNKKKEKGDGKHSEHRKLKGMKEKRKSLKKPSQSGENEDIDLSSVIYPCGVCNKEVVDSDEAILCEAGCEFWYHTKCAGMTDVAYLLLTKEDHAEWVCDKCIASKSVRLVKMKSVLETSP